MSNFLQSKRALRIYGISVIGVAAVCTVLRLLCILFFFDTDIGYYTSGAVLPTVLNVLLFVSAVGAFALCIIPKIRLTPSFPSAKSAVRRFAVLPAVGFAIYAVIYLPQLIDYYAIYGTLTLSYLLTEAASIGACVFFGFIAFRDKNDDTAFLLTGVLTVVWLVISLANCYFDTLVQMNSPNKLMFQFACLGAMLLTVNELRQGFGVRRKGFHLFSASVAVIFTLSSAVPSAVGYFTGNMPIAYSLIYADIVFILIAVFSAVRLIQLCFGPEEPITYSEQTETANGIAEEDDDDDDDDEDDDDVTDILTELFEENEKEEQKDRYERE